ncbi:MAG: bifunctional hydroxymethylpyrimidine kinase/phosphomethylpyrimidine kinase, partial [Chloroflexota bacterium]|nr:bifunctional hydroxymethylpyrimidine kinase/phosphomethylpyrimidine kinase [Chloroflexota bacterium]
MLDVQPEQANINRAMTIAGSDSGGGAGLQADLKAFAANGVYGTSVVTTVTSQNTLGVQEVLELPIELIESQIDSVLTDIGTDVVKTGMLYSSDVIRSVAAKISQYDIALLVVDPVMKAKGGAKLINDEAIDTLRNVLLPMATVVTPNAPEAQDLTGIVVDDIDSAREAAVKLVELGAKSAVVKGGHFDVGPATDVLFDGEEFRLFTTR